MVVHSRRRTDPSPKRDPIRDAVAARAYEMFLARGGTHGHDVEDWLQAEQELLGWSAQPDTWSSE